MGVENPPCSVAANSPLLISRYHNLGVLPWNEAGKIPTLSHFLNDINADDLFIQADLIDEADQLTDEGLAVMAELWEEGCLHS